MQTIYFISGLGADETVFSRLQLPGYNRRYLPWLMPEKNESIEHYAARMAKAIDTPNPIIAGLSFGGMMSIEIARQLPVQKVILISSVSQYTQLPLWMRLAGWSRVNKIIPMRPYHFLEQIENYNMGVETPDDIEILRRYRQQVQPQYLQWAINEILRWHNNWLPASLYHIHGTNDRIFPVQKLHPTHLVQGGGHFMVYNRAAEVSSILQAILAA
ncbi:MAG TPA: alpha/beta hydrolase [Ferruginibacter sp.]|nr:alpha/beta hydrolase [Ferruginibacter sp.]HMP21855.1 alpha/beta hydrolase [Ferruginibacter sp.]